VKNDREKRNEPNLSTKDKRPKDSRAKVKKTNAETRKETKAKNRKYQSEIVFDYF
jgi:hypothetical protein